MVALAVALGVVLVNPATGEGSTASSSTSLTGADTAATQAAEAARSTREKVAQVADAVTARAVAVRADGAQAQVPADQLAQLDALRTQVAELVSKVQAEDAAARTDRAGVASRGGSSAERSAVPAPSASGAAASPAPSAATTADPTSTDAALSEPSPTSSPTASAGTPTAAATPAPTAATSSGAATPDATPTPTASSTAAAPAPSSGATSSASSPSASPSAAASPASVDTPDQVAAAIPQVLGTDDPDAAQLRDAVIALARSTAAVSAAADANRTAAKAAADAATQQAAAAAEAAAAQAAAAAQRAAWKTSLQGYPNGQIPASALCAPTFDSGALLRCDAAEALDNLDAAYFQAFGVHLTINDSYRSYAAQVACLSTRGSLCAPPGTSHHGLGIAVDLGGGIEQTFSAQHAWMNKNAAAFGFVHPAWAQPDGSKPEPWHWEYTG